MAIPASAYRVINKHLLSHSAIDALREQTMVKLYKMDPSPPARACMIACELFNVPVEMVEVNLLEAGHLKPDYVKKNPLHTVPVLEDGDLIIHDSHAILMYLADVYGKQDSFYPKDAKQRSQVNQKLIYNATILFPRLRNITYHLLVENAKDIDWPKRLGDIEESYGFTEEFLSRTKYLAGNNITIADIAAYVTVISHENLLALNEQKFPKTHAWLKELGKLPYIQKHNTKGAEMLKQMIASKRA